MVENMRNPILWRILTILFVVAVPLFLIASNVRWAVNEMRLYKYGFDKFNIASNTGIPDDELMRAASQIRAYFNNGEEFLDVRVELGGVERSIYNQREILHMRDVKGLVQGVYQVQEGTGAYLLAFAVLGFALWRGGFWRRLARTARWGGAVTIGLLVLVGLLLLVGFSQVFLAFHLISFSNNLWQLDPYRDYLLRMFPEGFFLDATLFIALATTIEALLIGGVSWGALRWRGSTAREQVVTTRSETMP